jgi:AcrR family transcriptional regulator
VEPTSELPRPRRRVGRPRADPRAESGSPSEDILDAAASLFCSVGYTATTTRQIADAVGLRQGSLFHYFARKEDMLAELLDRTVEPTLGFVAWLDTVGAEPDVALTTLVRADVANLCSLPHNLGTLILLPESRGERFAAYWAKRNTLREHYFALVEASAQQGRIAVDDVPLATDLIFGLVESVITWYPRRDNRTPWDLAVSIADLVLRALVTRRDRLSTLMDQSEALLLRGAAADRADPGRSRPAD